MNQSITQLHSQFMASDLSDYVDLQREYRGSISARFGQSDPTGEVTAHAVAGSIKLADALTLRSAIKQLKPKKILEVGSFLGFSTRWILDSSRESGATVTSVDPRLRHRIFEDLKSHVLSFAHNDPRLICKDAFFSKRDPGGFLYDMVNYEPKLTEQQALEIINAVPVLSTPFDRFDLIFVDGDHSFDATRDNVQLALDMLNPGGLVIVHDAISWADVVPGVQQALKGRSDAVFMGVSGGDFREFLHVWWTSITARTTENEAATRHFTNSLCDGLAFISKPVA